MRKILFFHLIILSLASVQAQDSTYYNAYISNRMDLWKLHMDRMDAKEAVEQDFEFLLDLTVAQYGYIAYCMSMEQKRKAKEYVNKAEKNAKKMLRHDKNWARVHAILGAVYGFKAAQAPYKAPILGIKAQREIDKAFELDPTDPHIWMEKANVDLYKPAIFGGDKHKSIDSYLKAIELFEEDPDSISMNWLYLNTLSGLAIAYVRTDQINKADQTYRKILEKEPDFTWIRDDVYPGFRKKFF